jgi:hypothetical protein
MPLRSQVLNPYQFQCFVWDALRECLIKAQNAFELTDVKDLTDWVEYYGKCDRIGHMVLKDLQQRYGWYGEIPTVRDWTLWERAQRFMNKD